MPNANAEATIVDTNNNAKTSEILNIWNLLKSCNQTTYHIDVCILCSHFYYIYLKNGNTGIFKTNQQKEILVQR